MRLPTVSHSTTSTNLRAAQAKWGEEHGGRASGGGGPHARCRRAGLPIRSSGSQWPSTV